MSAIGDFVLQMQIADDEDWARSIGYVKPTPPISHDTQPLDYVVDDVMDDLPF